MSVPTTLPLLEVVLGLAGVLAVFSSVRFFFPALGERELGWHRVGMHLPWKRFPHEEPLLESSAANEVYQNLVEGFFQESGIGALFFGEDLTLRWMNRPAKMLLGNLQLDRREGGAVRELPEALDELLQESHKYQFAMRSASVLVASIRGKECHLVAQAMPLSDKTGNHYGMALFLWEAASWALADNYSMDWAAEIQRYKQLASVGVHAAGMAHEIKNPLVALKTFAELLPTKFDDAEFRDTFSKLALNEIRRIDSIVNDLLDYARPKKPVMVQANPTQVLQEALDILSAQITQRGIELRRADYRELPAVAIDVDQMRRVFLNILLNAVEAMPKGGHLTVTLSARGGRKNGAPGHAAKSWLEICVVDSGPGIEQKDLNRIFEPFYTTKKKGSGLGLAISKRIVEDHGGTIEFKSGAEGTQCIVRLPARQGVPAAAAFAAVVEKKESAELSQEAVALKNGS